MIPRRPTPTCLTVVLLLLSTGDLIAQPQASATRIRDLRTQAEQLERQADWKRACETYDALLQLDRRPSFRQRYQFCLQRYFQVLRLRDDSFRKEVLTLPYSQTLKLYQLVLLSLQENAVQRAVASPQRLFRKGLEELSHALANPAFVKAHLSAISPVDLQEFRASLQRTWGNVPVDSIDQASRLVREVAIKAVRKLRLPASVTVLEFTCGSCYAIDDYTIYLTPGQLRDLCDSLKGESVGVGLRLALNEGRMMIVEIIPGTSAARENPPLQLGDIVLSVERKSTAGLMPEAVLELLQGENGSQVQLLLLTATGERMVTLKRQPLFMPSVSYQPRPNGVGYIAISNFQESTPHELDAALVALGKETRGVILDLRGNSGGLFEAAIETARRFLSSGVIVSTLFSDGKPISYQSRNPAALTLPLVVLIDGDTASSAEVLAGALKENKRARILGQPSFGKGCIQDIVRLSPQAGASYPGGLRITVARFLSPNGTPYTGRGVIPDRVVIRVVKPDSLTGDSQLDQAIREMQGLIDTIR